MKKTILSIFMACGMTMLAQNKQDTKEKKDMDFVNEAAQAGLLEVKLGELAKTKGNSAEVKKLGEHMLSDHSKANKELMVLASKKSIAPPSTLDKEGQKHYDELSGKSGEEFDKAYSELMVKDHEKVISKFKKESNSGEDQDLKAWAEKTLPTLEHHLTMAKETRDKVKDMKDKDKDMTKKDHHMEHKHDSK
jgi:putative membrane protein